MRIVPLGEVCQIVNGGTPKSSITEYWEGNVAWLTPAQMGKQLSPRISATDRTISEKGLANSSAKLVPPSSVILSTRAPIGHLSINEVPMAFNQGCRGLVPGDHVDTGYLYYFLYYSRSALDALGTGTTFKELAATRLKEFPIPLPLMAEQRRIVSILDEVFAGIATATANTEKNLANVRELRDTSIAEMLEGEGSVVSSRRLDQVCVVDWGNTELTKKSYQSDGEFLAVSAAGCDGRIGHKEHRAFTPVLSAIGARCGRMFLPTEDFTAIKNTITLTPKAGEVDSSFLYYLLTSVDLPKRGAAQPFIAKGDIQKFLVQIPDLKRQQVIVNILDDLHHRTAMLEAHYTSRLDAIEELRHSLLAKAFSGELTSLKQVVAV